MAYVPRIREKTMHTIPTSFTLRILHRFVLDNANVLEKTFPLYSGEIFMRNIQSKYSAEIFRMLQKYSPGATEIFTGATEIFTECHRFIHNMESFYSRDRNIHDSFIHASLNYYGASNNSLV